MLEDIIKTTVKPGYAEITEKKSRFIAHTRPVKSEEEARAFIEEIKKSYPGIEVAGVHPSFDEAGTVEHIIESALSGIPDINGILVVSGGQAGIGAAFETLHLEKRPFVIIYDQTQKNEKVLQEDKADFLIDQNGYKQGYLAPYVLANLLLKGETPAHECLYTDIIIKTKYNL